MNPDVTFSIILVALLMAVVFLSLRYGMLKDNSADPASPYSWSRVQLAWWTIIILSSFVAILFIYNDAPTLTTSTVVLLGISSATTAAAKMIQVADQAAPPPPPELAPPPQVTEGFILDILSDKRSVSIPRFQTVVFNLAFGIWFIVVVFEKLHTLPDDDINAIMPDFAPTNLVLLGLSSATYAALKMTEK